MNFRQLDYFLAIARHGSQTEASRQLHVSQPALGIQIRALEQEFGLPLFVRRSRGMELTDAGRHLLAQTEEIFERLAQMKVSMQTFRSERIRKMTIGVPPTPGKALMPGLLDACRLSGEISLGVREGLSADLVSQLAAGHLDLALCYDPPATKSVRCLPLFHEDLVLIGPNDLLDADLREVAFPSLEHLPMILDSTGQITRKLIDQLAKAHDVTLDIVMELESINLKRDFLLSHRAFSIVPYGLFLDSIAAGQFNWAQIRDPSITRTLCLMAGRQVTDDDFTAFLDLLIPILRQKIETGGLLWRWADDY